MDGFATPEAFIRSEILANRGTNSVVTKEHLAHVAGWKAEKGESLNRKSKAELLDLLIEQYGEKAYSMFPVGVPSICFQLKFGITHPQVLKLAKAGLITVTGERKFHKYGKYLYAKTYSPYDYFRLTFRDVHKMLEDIRGNRQHP